MKTENCVYCASKIIAATYYLHSRQLQCKDHKYEIREFPNVEPITRNLVSCRVCKKATSLISAVRFQSIKYDWQIWRFYKCENNHATFTDQEDKTYTGKLHDDLSKFVVNFEITSPLTLISFESTVYRNVSNFTGNQYSTGIYQANRIIDHLDKVNKYSPEEKDDLRKKIGVALKKIRA